MAADQLRLPVDAGSLFLRSPKQIRVLSDTRFGWGGTEPVLEARDDDTVRSLTPEALAEMLRSPNGRERSIAIRLAGRVMGTDVFDGGTAYTYKEPVPLAGHR